jgi:hypothetical protein
MNKENTPRKEAPKKELRKESPLKGWPKTRPLRDKEDKTKGYRVRAKYLTPGRAKFSEDFVTLIGGCMTIAYFGALFAERLVGWRQILTVGVIYLVVVAVLGAARFVLGRALIGKVTKLEFLPDTIRIKTGFRFRNYDRSLPHEFNFSIHDKAEDEQEKEVEAAMRQKSDESVRRKFYRKSFHVILRYAGQRIDVASVFGKNDAEALLVRLQLLDQLMDAMRGDSTAAAFADTDTQYGLRPEAG